MRTGTAVSYRVFVRNWWRRGPPDYGQIVRHKLVPDPSARKTTLARRMTYDEARAMCAEYARTHKPGLLSRKAEFEEE